MSKLLCASLCALAASLSTGAATALAAAPGSLTFTGCVAEPLSESCGAQGFGLEQPEGVAISPDGDNAYVAGAGGGAVAVLDRSSTGVLTFAACFGGTDSGSDPQCSTDAGVLTPEAVAISSDGSDVYVLDHGQIDIFSRAPDGSLTSIGCVGDLDAPSCGAAAPGHTLYPYRFGAIAVSADGKEVYTATDDGGGSNGAVDAFSRSADGLLTTLGCVAASGGEETQCASESPALAGAGSLALSPDGHVFVGGSDAVASFTAHANGMLSADGCIGAAAGCTAVANLDGPDYSPNSLALSPDGSTLYVSAHLSPAIQELSQSDGKLTEIGCVGGATSTGCDTTATPICAPEGLAVSDDGADLYALDDCSDTLMTFARDAGGALTYQGCAADTISTYACASNGVGLDGPLGLAITPDDSQVLVTGEDRDSLAAFARTPDLAPAVSLTTPANGETYTVGDSVRAEFSCIRVAGGSPIASCTGTVADGGVIDTATAGSRTFTVTATDLSGLETKRSVTYTIVGLGTPGAAGGATAGELGGSAGIPGSKTGTVPRRRRRSHTKLGAFAQQHRRWSERRSQARHGAPYGTRFSFNLRRASSVTLTFSTVKRHHTVIVGRLILHAKAGESAVAFDGRLSRRLRLAPGAYEVTLSVTSSRGRVARGQAAGAPALRFTIAADTVRPIKRSRPSRGERAIDLLPG